MRHRRNVTGDMCTCNVADVDVATIFIIQQVHVYMEGAKCCSE